MQSMTFPNEFSKLRPDGRGPGVLRPVTIAPGIAPAAAGSVLISMGNTRVLCAATIEEAIPRWMRLQKVSGGWVTAEYSMLPYATTERSTRESTSGKVSGRTHEIQRLIGRSMRAVTDLDKLGERTIWLDCDVLQADGGTRTAAITGAFVAYRLAVNQLMAKGAVKADPIREAVAAISVGVVADNPVLDLCYEEDVAAEVDMNVVMTESMRFVEIQGTAEEQPFSRERMQQMLELAEKGITALIKNQQEALKNQQ